MTPQQLVGLGVRLIAIWVFIRAVYLFSLNGRAFLASDMPDKVLNTALFAGWWLGIAVVLWFFPMWIAHKLIPKTRFDNKLNLQPLEAARVGCCLIGLWLLSNDLHVFLWLLFQGALSPGEASVIRHLSDQERLQLLAVIVEIGFALALVFGSARFAAVALGAIQPKEGGGNDT